MLDQTLLQIPQIDAFRDDVAAGLSRAVKFLPSRWLYDARGSELFEEITRLDDYYLTRAETSILRRHAGEIADFCGAGLLLLEYGAGAGIKTEILVEALESPRLYVPIDIAGDVVARTASRFRRRFPRLETRPIVADFMHDFTLPAGLPAGRRAAFFPGSTIGNLDANETGSMMRMLRRHVGARGTAVIGVDLKKDIATLLAAYDDREGVTATFNLNLLARINRELDGDFPLDRFVHRARWNEAESAVEMHLVSLDARVVTVGGRGFRFQAGESIHTESSRKYAPRTFAEAAERSGWRLGKIWRDPDELFAVFGLEV
jgi:dimethylhistidine N-methyltransferase